ncbi:MAG TPA: sigma-70 family RNA polymerase sigma factor [bacterium]
MIQTPRDDELMLAAGQGDVQAFEQIVLRHQAFAWSVAYRFVGNREDAEDLVQDAFLRLLAAAARYRPTASFRTYLSRIICRLCLDHMEKKRPVVCDELPECADTSPLPDGIVVREEQASAVRRGITLLPPNQRLAIILRYYEDCSYRDIAEAMDTTEKAVERLLARGREALGNTLKDWD